MDGWVQAIAEAGIKFLYREFALGFVILFLRNWDLCDSDIVTFSTCLAVAVFSMD